MYANARIIVSVKRETHHFKGVREMTQKDLMKIVENADLMYTLLEMREIQQNLIYKTVYEKKTAAKRMKELAKEIIAELKD